MALLDPPPEIRGICPRCHGDHLHRWAIDLERPGTAWSVCAGCEWISVWNGGRLERPPDATGDELFSTAVGAILAAAEAARVRAGDDLAHLQRELTRTASEMEQRRGFLDRFARYRQQAGDDGQRRGSDGL